MKRLNKVKHEVEKLQDNNEKLIVILGEIVNSACDSDYLSFGVELCDMILRNGVDFRTISRKGFLLYKLERFAEAVQEFSYLIEHNQDHTTVDLYDRARALLYTAEYEQALDDLTNILKKKHEFETEGYSLDLINLMKGLVYQRKNSFKEALEELQAGLTLNPENETIINLIEQIKKEMHDYEIFLILKGDLEKKQIDLFQGDLERFSPINYQDPKDENRSLLHYAIIDQSTEAVQLLLKRGADPCLTMFSGLTALHLAARSGDHQIIALLLAAGADLYAVADVRGGTLLNMLVQNNQLDTISALVKGGADINRSITQAATPLHQAVINNNSKAVKLLLHLGADMNSADDEGVSPYDLAIENSYIEIEDLFREQI